MSEPRELELKLEVSPRQLARLKGKGLQPLGEPRARQHLTSIYFDTPDHRLHRKGLSLRVRSAGGRYVQTIKEAEGSAGIGLFNRSEWETELDSPEPDLEAASRTPVRKILAHGECGGLRAIFTAEVERTIWLVETEAAAIEVALDEGTVEANGARSAVAELELELKRGEPGELFVLARALDQTGSLKLGIYTKSERGYRLAAGEEAGFHKADPVQLSRGTSVTESFAAIIRACIRHFRLNEEGVLQARHPEALHQARVAMRRLRSALSLFKDFLKDAESAALRARLKAFSDHLGHARNLDVYLQRAEATPGGEPAPDPAWIARLKTDREAAYDKIAEALRSRRFRSLLLDVLAWAEAGDWRRPTDPEVRTRLAQPIEVVAAEILDKHRRRLKRHSRHLATLEPEARHEVRIEAKKLRYASEFFSGLAEGKRERKRLKSLLSALEDLQDTLGSLNDLETARALHQAQPSEEGEAVAPPEINEAESERELLDRAIAAQAAFEEAKPFWRDFA